MLLTGTFNRALDEKLRIAIPKHLRDALPCPPGGESLRDPWDRRLAHPVHGCRLPVARSASCPKPADAAGREGLQPPFLRPGPICGTRSPGTGPHSAGASGAGKAARMKWSSWGCKITWKSGHESIGKPTWPTGRPITTKLRKRRWEVLNKELDSHVRLRGSPLVETRSPVAIGHSPAMLHRPPHARCVFTGKGEWMLRHDECGSKPVAFANGLPHMPNPGHKKCPGLGAFL